MFTNGRCECLEEFYQNGMQCEMCADGCSKCDNGESCLECKEGMVIDELG